MKRGSLLLPALLLAAALMPAAHLLAHADVRCATCPAPTGPGSLLVAGCEGPCDDASHHHHGRGHAGARCPCCQATFLAPGLSPPGVGTPWAPDRLGAPEDRRLAPAGAPPGIRSRAPPPAISP